MVWDSKETEFLYFRKCENPKSSGPPLEINQTYNETGFKRIEPQIKGLKVGNKARLDNKYSETDE